MKIFRIVRDIVRRQFLSGVLVVVPLIITYVVLRFLFESVDGILSPLIAKLLNREIPGLGIIATILIILLAGFLTRNIIGATLIRYADKALARMPIIRIFYLAAKQLIEAVTVPNIKAFKEVVMIEYPRRGIYAIGFATTKVKFECEKENARKLVGVFIPSTPTPMTGIVVFLPEDEIITIRLTIEEGLKLIVSGGIVSPESICRAEKSALEEL
ncbi:conserved hypothetical protein [Candidatus Zixiibacteriota bacterium]|nr:conserved hypothetical protein [candidate division Zixibacteria bacterium]